MVRLGPVCMLQCRPPQPSKCQHFQVQWGRVSGVQPAVSYGGTRGTIQGVVGGEGEEIIGYEEV